MLELWRQAIVGVEAIAEYSRACFNVLSDFLLKQRLSTTAQVLYMPVTIWKGHITFGLVSIPVRLRPAACAERVSLRQLYRHNARERGEAASSIAVPPAALIPERKPMAQPLPQESNIRSQSLTLP